MRVLLRLVGYAIAIALVAVLGRLFISLYDPTLASIEFDEFEWQATETGFFAEDRSQRDQKICLCRMFACEVPFELDQIAYEGWLRRYFVIVKDPLANHSDLGRPVRVEPICVDKKKGEALTLKLSEFKGPDSDGVGKATYLRLEIE
jgi:hypothetical protein